QRAVGELGRERRAEGARFHLARQRVVVAARLRPEHRAALAPQRVARLADLRAAGALLAPRLLAGAADHAAGLGLVRALPLRRVLANHRFPDQPGIHAPAEHLVADVERADLLVVVVDDVNLHKSPEIAN